MQKNEKTQELLKAYEALQTEMKAEIIEREFIEMPSTKPAGKLRRDRYTRFTVYSGRSSGRTAGRFQQEGIWG